MVCSTSVILLIDLHLPESPSRRSGSILRCTADAIRKLLGRNELTWRSAAAPPAKCRVLSKMPNRLCAPFHDFFSFRSVSCWPVRCLVGCVYAGSATHEKGETL